MVIEPFHPVVTAMANTGDIFMAASEATDDETARVGFGSSQTVLVVDDEPDIVEEVVETLEDEGFDCLSAGNAVDALALLQSRTDISIIVSDIRMPGMDGLTMAKEAVALKEQGRDVSVIMVTGHAGMTEAIDALKIGVDDFLTKPISPDHLVHSVERSRELVKLRWQDRAFKVALETEVAERTAEVRALMAQLEKRNEELTLANRVKTEFLDMISHEMNTPLNAVLGFAQLALSDAEKNGDTQMVETVEEIIKGGNRLHKKVKAVLSMADATRAGSELHLENIAGADLLALVADSLRGQAEDKGVTLETDVVGSHTELTADVGRLSQAVRYLADNAIRYSNEKGSVLIRLDTTADNMVSIAVKDEGPGMTPEQLEIALEPMRRGSGAIGDQEGGIGLGLPLARSFAELHGGSMLVDTAPNKGTTVTLAIPRVAMS